MAKSFRSHQSRIAYAHDVVMAGLSFVAAVYLRVSPEVFPFYAEEFLLEGTAVFTLVAAVVFASMRLYRGIWRYASLNDMVAIAKAVTLTILIFLPLMFMLTRLDSMPRSVLVINWFVLMTLLGGPRILYRILKDRRLDNVLTRDSARRVPVLLIGSGDGAELFLRGAVRRRDSNYRAVGILSERRSRVGQQIHGIEILGTVDEATEAIGALERHGRKPSRLILTKDDMSGAEVRKLFDTADALGVSLARIPQLTDFKAGVEDKVEPRPIAIEDLLGRPQTVLDRPAMKALIEGREVMVTGAGGSIGSELVRQISDLGPAHLDLFDNSEYHLYEIDDELSRRHPGLARNAHLADVRDAGRVDAVLAGARPDLVFHAAALKHVPMVEIHPLEGVLTNVIGTRNVADSCRKAGVAEMVLISTDKAVNPTNVMGATKRMAESYCQAWDITENRKGGGTRFITVRFGNVLGSTGSVVPRFQKQLAAGGPLTITHPDITRYFMTVREAVELVLQASALGAGGANQDSGKIFVLDMGEPVRIQDLARQMIRLSGLEPDVDAKIEFSGLRPGEKLHEELLHEAEALVPTDHKSILLAAPRTADHKLLAKAIDELESASRAGEADKVLKALTRLVPEFKADVNGQSARSAAR